MSVYVYNEKLRYTAVYKGFNLNIYDVLGDGSCLLHCVCAALLPDYIVANDVDRKQLVRRLRNELAKEFNNYYYSLDNHITRSIAVNNTEFSYDTLYNELLSSRSLGITLLSYICDKLVINIYILYTPNGLLIPYKLIDNQVYYRNRKSIIVYYTGDHFMLIAVKCNDNNIHVYDYNSPIIRSLNEDL